MTHWPVRYSNSQAGLTLARSQVEREQRTAENENCLRPGNVADCGVGRILTTIQSIFLGSASSLFAHRQKNGLRGRGKLLRQKKKHLASFLTYEPQVKFDSLSVTAFNECNACLLSALGGSALLRRRHRSYKRSRLQPTNQQTFPKPLQRNSFSVLCRSRPLRVETRFRQII